MAQSPHVHQSSCLQTLFVLLKREHTLFFGPSWALLGLLLLIRNGLVGYLTCPMAGKQQVSAWLLGDDVSL